jgi:putative phosphoesterase
MACIIRGSLRFAPKTKRFRSRSALNRKQHLRKHIFDHVFF